MTLTHETTLDTAPARARELVAIANQLLEPLLHPTGPSSDEEGSRPFGSAALIRVARLGDEFRATANRIALFDPPEDPVFGPVRVTERTGASAVLGPEQILAQLDEAASRLTALLETRSARDWTHVTRVGDGLVTLGELVDRVLAGASRDLRELLAASRRGAQRATRPDARTRAPPGGCARLAIAAWPPHDAPGPASTSMAASTASAASAMTSS